MAMAPPYSSGGNTSYSVACAVDNSAPPPRPWMIRNTTSSVSVCELPHRMLAIVNSAIEPAK